MIGFAPGPLYEPAKEILARLRAAGHEAYIAGGAVRDYLLGRPQTDLDIASSARPEEVRGLFRRTFAVGEAFGVVIVHLRGHDFEVATFREEEGYLDGRRPTRVHYSTARADVARRDFTINGMLWDAEREEVLDWVDGREDIQRRVVRTIGDPVARFAEDRLRMLRALRFCAQLDFELDPATLEGIRRQACHLPLVSQERIRLELEKLFRASAAGRGLDLLEPSALGPVLRSRTRDEAATLSNKKAHVFGCHISWDWLTAWLSARTEPAGDWGLQGLTCFLLDVAGWQREEWQLPHSQLAQSTLEPLGRALRFSRPELNSLKSCAWLLCQLPTFTSLRLADQLRCLRRPEASWLLPVLGCLPVWQDLPFELMINLIAQHRERWLPEPFLRGEDLRAHGVAPGPGMGRLLEELETLQLEGTLESVESARLWLATRSLG